MATNNSLNRLVKDLGSVLNKLTTHGPLRGNSRQQAKKPTRKQRKLKNSAKRGNGFSMQGSSRMFESAQPVAVDTCLKNPVYLRVSGKVSHADFGDGVRIEGRQLLTDVTTTAGDNQLFGNNGTATVTTVNVVQLSPDQLNGRLALQARNYSRYAFRKATLHYVPRVATTDVGQMVIAYSIDGGESSVATNSFQALTSMAPNMVTPFRKECSFNMTYTGDLTWMTEADTSTVPGFRSTIQGLFLGFPDLTSIGAVQHGWLWIEYVIDLYGQNADYGFTYSLRSKEEKEAVRAFLEKQRAGAKDEDSWSVCSDRGRARLHR